MLASVREPLGNAVLEAMAMQTPVIASRSGGIPEILDEACGTLVAPGAVREFAAALRCVARGDEPVRQKAHHARRVACRRFSIDSHVEDISTALPQVAG